MIRLAYSPEWFHGKDLVMDIISLFVLLVISGFAVKCYKINKNKSYLTFSLAFSFLSLSFLFKILTNFTIYYTSWIEKDLGLFTLTYQTLSKSNILVIIGFLGYFFFGLVGLMSLWLVYKKETSKATIFLLTYFILLTAYLGMIDYFVFHLTSLIFLIFLTATYLRNSEKNNSLSAKILAYAFLIITFSQLIFVFMGVNPLFYVTAEIVQLVGYLMLFSVFFRIIQNGKKK